MNQYPNKNLHALHFLTDNFLIVEFDPKAASIYGKIKAKLKAKGNLISDNDLLIASHALSLNLTLMTNNTKEYKRIEGLIIENWI